MFRRISTAAAKRFFAQGLPVVLCPCKCVPAPGHPFVQHVTVSSADWRKPWIEDPWRSMLNEWKHYNASYEMGYYPHFYVEEASPRTLAEDDLSPVEDLFGIQARSEWTRDLMAVAADRAEEMGLPTRAVREYLVSQKITR
jgi:hypothetical protein